MAFSRWSCAGLSACALLSGCAGFHHMKGKAEIAMDRPDEGVQSLNKAAKADPRNPLYQIDHLSERDKYVALLLAEAEKARADGDLEKARAGYEAVLKFDRGNMRASEGLDALQQEARNARLLAEGERSLSQGKPEAALERAGDVLANSPRSKRALKLKESALDALNEQQLALDRARAARRVLESPVTLQLRDATLRIAFESIARTTGLNILFDKDVKQDARVSIFVRDVTVLDAVDLILLQNQLEKRMVNANTLLIYPASAAKQADYEDLVIRTFRATNADVKYLASMLKSMLKLREVSADDRSSTIVVRDTAERVRVAERLVAAHDVPEPEIMLEVQVLEVASGRNSNLGVQPPAGITFQTPGAAGTMTVRQLRNLSGNDLIVSPLSASINFKLEDTDAKVLASPRIRSRNKEKARIMIGDRVPTITNTVTPISTGGSVVTGNVTYQDVGLKLEFEPQVYGNQEVGIKVNLEVSNIVQAFTDPQGGRSYQIGTRNANTTLRLKDGETQVLGGLISDQDRNTASLIPGLGHLPIVGKLFGNNDGTTSRSEIVLAITPRILRDVPAPTPDTRNIFSGTANMVRDRPILAEPLQVLRVQERAGVVPPATAAPSAQPAATAPAQPPAAAPAQAPAATAPPPPPSTALPPPPPMINRNPRTN